MFNKIARWYTSMMTKMIFI